MADLIVCFSRAGENYVGGIIKDLKIGNTMQVANIIKKLTGDEIFQLEMVKPYSTHYNDCINEAQEDQRNNTRPTLKALPASIDQYSTIYLGYPDYWGTMPMAVLTFLGHFDFTGKTIKPFCTHEGSGFGHSLTDLRSICPTAKIAKGLAIHGSKINNSLEDIKAWVKENN